MKSRFSSSLLVVASMSLYPIAYMWRAIAEGSRIGSGPSDMNGTLIIFQSLRLMDTPWAPTARLSFPNGSEFWEPVNVIHGAPMLMGWVLTRVLEPIQVLNIFIFVGWTLSGLSAYWIARILKMQVLPAVCAGILVQMLPWFAVKVPNHIFYVWYFLPLSAIALALSLRISSEGKLVGFGALAFCLAFTFFTDTYLFVISVFGVGVVVLYMPTARGTLVAVMRKLSRTSISQRLLIVGALVLLAGVGFSWFGGFLNEFNQVAIASGNPARGVTGFEELIKWSGSIKDFVTPGSDHWLFSGEFHQPGESDFVTYGGIFPVVLVAFLFGINHQRSRSKEVACLFLVALGCMLAALRPFNMFGVQVSVNSIMRYVLPGIRVFARFAVVSQALLVILAVYSATLISSKFSSRKYSVPLLGCLLIGIGADLSPHLNAPTYSNLAHYEQIQQELEDSGSTGGLLIPDGKLEAIDLSMETAPDSIDWPIVNDFQGKWRPPVLLRAGLGSLELSAYLLSRDINRVIARTDSLSRPVIRGFLQDSVRTDLVLDAKYFKPLMRQMGMDGQEVVLLEVIDSGTEQTCEKCQLAQLLFSPQLDSLGAAAGQLIDGILWSQGSLLEFHSELIDNTDTNVLTRARIEIVTLDPNVVVTLETSTGEIIKSTIEGDNGKVFDFVLPTNSSYRFRASGPCGVTTATSGPYCWGIGEFVVVTTDGV